MTEMREDIWDVLARYLSRESSPKDHDLIDAWKTQEAKNHKSLTLLNSARFRNKKIDDSTRLEVFEDVFSKIENEQSRPYVKIWFAVAIAASFALLIGTAALFYFLGDRKQGMQTVEMYAPRGIKSKIVLPDGSQVMLNSDSKLTYPVRFGTNAREVLLNGEAYFTIKKDKQHPFVVKTGALEVKVLGTKFNLKAYDSDDVIATTLDEGLVSLSTNTGKKIEKKNILLTPGKQAIWNKQKRSMELLKVDPYIYSGWCTGKYYFKASTFDQIAHTLEIGFNVTIDIQSEKLKNEVFSGDFVRSENIEQILSVIKKNTNIKYKISGSKIVITEK